MVAPVAANRRSYARKPAAAAEDAVSPAEAEEASATGEAEEEDSTGVAADSIAEGAGRREEAIDMRFFDVGSRSFDVTVVKVHQFFLSFPFFHLVFS